MTRRGRTQRALLLALLLGACAGAPARPVERERLMVVVRVETLPPREIDGSPAMRASVRAIDRSGAVRAELDLDEIGVDGESCQPMGVPELPSDEGAEPIGESTPVAAFGCSGIHTLWAIVLVQRGAEVEVRTQLRDEEEGPWQLDGISLEASADVVLASEITID